MYNGYKKKVLVAVRHYVVPEITRHGNVEPEIKIKSHTLCTQFFACVFELFHIEPMYYENKKIFSHNNKSIFDTMPLLFTYNKSF